MLVHRVSYDLYGFDLLQKKIADFGMARELAGAANDYYASALAMVPLRWTAPETLKMCHHSPMSDVWSFGILCCEVLSNGEKVWNP